MRGITVGSGSARDQKNEYRDSSDIMSAYAMYSCGQIIKRVMKVRIHDGNCSREANIRITTNGVVRRAD